MRLIAHDTARVQVVVPAGLRGQPLRLTVDGRGKTLVRRPATFSVSGLETGARWHWLVVHGRRRTVTTRLAVGRRRGRDAPTLVVTRAPGRSTGSAVARFRYSASGGRVACALDGHRAPCRHGRASVHVRPGAHVFEIRARRGGGVTSLSWPWTVRSPGSGGPTAGRRLLLADDFDGASLNRSRWRVYGPDWPGHAGNGIRDTSAVSVGGGVLTITARMVGGVLVSGGIASRASTTYGRVEFRARVDADPSQATSGVVLMWPDSENWPVDGETDIFETGTGAARDAFTSAVHYGADNRQIWFTHHADATRWQRMAMEWAPTSISFYRDGTLEGQVTDPAAIAHASQHLTVQLDAFSPTMSGVVRLQVDDVRMYGPA